MKKNWWRRWTVERPAAFGDWLWLALVVLPANVLDRLTVRKVIVLSPVAILAIAFAHNIPLPPAIVFPGDALAYLDILTILFMLAAIGRAGALLYFVRQATGNALRWLARALTTGIGHADSRHRRAHRESARKRSLGRLETPEGDGAPLHLGAAA
jgi:hypothetical protein